MKRALFMSFLVGSLLNAFGQTACGGVVDPTLLDRNVSPCTDFFQFACGSWLKNTPIPDDHPMVSRGFYSIGNKNKKLMSEILQRYADGKFEPQNPSAKQMGDFYAACMNETLIEANGLRDYRKAEATYGKLSSKPALAKLVGKLSLIGANPFFRFYAEQSYRDPSQLIGFIDQGGLSLPNRDYYLSSEPSLVAARNELRQYIIDVLAMLGDKVDLASKKAEQILKIETELAEISMPAADHRDPAKTNHELSLADLKKLMPSFSWPSFFQSVGVGPTGKFNLSSTEYAAGLEKLIKARSTQELSAYLSWQFVSVMSTTLPRKFVERKLKLYKTLIGIERIPDRWKRCTEATGENFGFALGAAFADVTLGKKGKQAAETMMEGIHNQMEKLLQEEAWMDQSTQKLALEKLALMPAIIGYPDHPRSYRSVKVTRDSYFGNVLASAEFNRQFDYARIGKNVDRAEWTHFPYETNAVYEERLNTINFLAGILQPPVFSLDQELIANYAAIGMMMGHEITHGFDDQGSQYDARGGLKDWWNPVVKSAFQKKAECLIQQFDSYQVNDNLHVNGHLTLGENIGDQGGLKLAYRAWQGLGKKNDAADGFSPDQQFFLAYAQAWCAKASPAFEVMITTSDAHALDRFRVNGTLSNDLNFRKAFQCEAGQPMARKDRCEVW